MSLTCGAVEYFVKIPDALWVGIAGTIIGTSLTLLGTWRSNKNSRAQLRMQIEATAMEKAREREFELKRAVFSEVGGWLSQTTVELGRMIIVGTPDSLPNSKRELSVVPVQIQVVGNPESVDLCLQVSQAHAHSVSELRPTREKIDEKITELREARRHRDNPESMKLSHTPEYRALVETIARDEEKLREEFRVFASQGLSRLRDFNRLTVKLVVALRRELGLDIDAKVYEQLMENALATDMRVMEGMIESIVGPRTPSVGAPTGNPDA